MSNLKFSVLNLLFFILDFRCGLIVATSTVKVAANDFQISMTISKNGYLPERLTAEVTLFAITRLTLFVTFPPHLLTSSASPLLAPFLLNRHALKKKTGSVFREEKSNRGFCVFNFPACSKTL